MYTHEKLAMSAIVYWFAASHSWSFKCVSMTCSQKPRSRLQRKSLTVITQPDSRTHSRRVQVSHCTLELYLIQSVCLVDVAVDAILNLLRSIST